MLNKTDKEIIDFLTNCYSIESAIRFFHIKQKNTYSRKNELLKICSKYGFSINDLTFESYMKRQKEMYYKNPKRCLYCNEIIPFEKRYKTFCNSSCAAKYNNCGRKLSEETKNKISKSLKNWCLEHKVHSEVKTRPRPKRNPRPKRTPKPKDPYSRIHTKLIILNGETIRIDKIRVSHLYYENKIDFDTVKKYFPELIRICRICGKEFVLKVLKARILSNLTTCSEKCRKELRIANGKQNYINIKNAGKFKGWMSRNISSYAEKYWMDVLTNLNIPFIREYHLEKYFLDFKIEINGYNIDLEIDGKQHTYSDRKEHDKIRDAFIEERGYLVYRISWNCINTDEGKELMKDKIDKFLIFYNSLKTKEVQK